jgi:hypothetical protein
MATENLTKTLPTARVEVARDAVWQIDSLLAVIKQEVKNTGGCCDLLLAALVPRLIDLTSVAMSVIAGDDGRETEEMQGVVHG